MARGDYLGEFELVVMLALARFDSAYGKTVYQEIERVTGRADQLAFERETCGRVDHDPRRCSWSRRPGRQQRVIGFGSPATHHDGIDASAQHVND